MHYATGPELSVIAAMLNPHPERSGRKPPALSMKKPPYRRFCLWRSLEIHTMTTFDTTFRELKALFDYPDAYLPTAQTLVRAARAAAPAVPGLDLVFGYIEGELADEDYDVDQVCILLDEAERLVIEAGG